MFDHSNLKFSPYRDLYGSRKCSIKQKYIKRQFSIIKDSLPTNWGIRCYKMRNWASTLRIHINRNLQATSKVLIAISWDKGHRMQHMNCKIFYCELRRVHCQTCFQSLFNSAVKVVCYHVKSIILPAV